MTVLASNLLTCLNEEPNFEKKVRNFLKGEGYGILQQLGEGNTRTTYLTRYRSGGIDKSRVVKIPKSELGTSVCTKINLSKGDPNKSEVKTSNQINHPNVVQILDSFDIEGQTINVEEYFQAQDLESLVKAGGSITDEEKFEGIFKQAIEGLDYLNWTESILHRDIKPGNILVNSSGLAKITDLQNSKKINNIEDLCLPTRGGTPYTHPDLLESLVSGEQSSANRRTEAYALGATMFYALTGEDPFDYKIEFDDKGRELDLEDGTSIRVGLKVSGNSSKLIDKKEHERKLKKNLKKIPKKYRKVIHKCLSLDDKFSQYGIECLQSDFSKVSGNFRNRFKENFIKALKPSLITAASLSVLFGFIALSQHVASQEPHRPTLIEIMRENDYRHFTLKDVDIFSNNYALDFLAPDIYKLRNTLTESKEDGIQKKIKNFVHFSNNIVMIDEKLGRAFLTASMLTDEEKTTKKYIQAGQNRLPPTYVPKNFILMNRPFNTTPLDEHSSIVWGTHYLKLCLPRCDNVMDVFANYYSKQEDIITAMQKAGSLNYLPSLDEDRHTIKEGYGEYMPQKGLINNAILTYLLMNENGDFNFDKLPKFYHSPKNMGLAFPLR
ncbi:protein kinase [archaeon]|nr:protein kinase [archaeon]